MYGTYRLAWLWLPVLFYASTAIGQIGPDTGALQRQLQLQLERARPAPLAPSLPPAETRTQSTNEQKIKINGFIFKGNRLQSAEKLNATVAHWTEREVLFTEMPDITTAIQDSYAKLGRLAVANIPPQDVKDGLVVIEILEAKLGRVHIDTDQTETVRFTAKRAKRFLVERNDGTVFINTKSFERAITLINELSGVRAEGSFEAGEKFGFSDIRVKLTDGPLFSGQVATSNYGSSSTGNIQAIANLSLNNPFGRGDQITLDAIQSLGSTYGQAAYNTPIGFGGWKLGAQASYLTYQTTQGWGTPQTAGTGNSFGANASYALFRSQGANSTLRFSLENRNSSAIRLSLAKSQSWLMTTT
ncbi:MAG: ShlB/FhaC/HecB family hemolysin secretion/activation protein, partial [Alcaligenaceae bacterium]